MALFGGYETVRELYRSGPASSFTARKVGEAGAEKYLVKFFQPYSSSAGEAELRGRIEAFLDGARAQQKVASEGAGHWASVHETGTVQGGAYFAGEYHRRTLQQLIRGQVKLDGRRLHDIVSGILQGLTELKRICGRPYGNLKSSNVLLTGRGPIARANILLTDPVGQADLDKQLGDVVDMHALGELIYQLVLHRTGRAMGGWPAPDSAEWRRLGKNGEPWRQFCNRLLNPNLAPGLMTFEDLADDLKTLREGGGLLSAKVLIPAVAVLAALGVGGDLARGKDSFIRSLFVQAVDPPPPAVDYWGQWRDEYRAWVSLFIRNFDKLDAAALDRWTQDAHLSRSVVQPLRKIRADKTPLDPRVVGKVPGGVRVPAGTTPDSARTPAVAAECRKLLELFKSVRDSMDSHKWPAFTKVDEAYERFSDRGWSAPADRLQYVLELPDGQAVRKIGLILDACRRVELIEAEWRAVEQLRAKLAEWGDGNVTPLVGLDEYVLHETAAAGGEDADSLQRVADRLRQLRAPKSVLRDMEAFTISPEAKVLDWPSVADDPPIKPPADGAVTEQVLRHGLAVLKGPRHRLIGDPRKGGAIARMKAECEKVASDAHSLRDGVAKLRRGGKLTEEQTKTLTALAGVADTAEARLKGLEAALDQIAAAPAQSSAQRRKIADDLGRADAARKEQAGLVTGANGMLLKVQEQVATASLGSWNKYVAAQEAIATITSAATPAIDGQWQRQRQALIAAEQAGKDVAKLAPRIDNLKTFLQQLDGQFAKGFTDTEIARRPWSRDVVDARARDRRAGALGRLLKQADWAKVAGGQQDASFEAQRKQELAGYDAWRAGTVSLTKDFNRIQDLLAAGYGLDEPPGVSAQTLRQLHDRQQRSNSAVYADPNIAPALKPMVDRLAALGAVASSTDTASLAATARAGAEGRFEAARAAWLRLGRPGAAWPGSAPDLEQEAQIRRSLASLYAKMPDGPRKTELVGELDRQGRLRWQGYFVRGASAGQIEAAVGKMSQFGLDASKPDALSAWARLRLAVYRLRGAVDPQAGSRSDDQVKSAIGQFSRDVTAIGGGVAERQDVASLLGGLQRIQAQTGGGVDLSQAGPAKVGWSRSGSSDDPAVYTWTGGTGQHRLTFRRVTPAGGQPAYLSTTEVPVGLFIDVLTGGQKWSEMKQLLPREAADIYGPRVWTADAGGVKLSKEWYGELPSLLVGKLYDARLPPGRITGAHPVQQVSLGASILFTRLLNCRLPTPEEWAEARRQSRQQVTNLRDNTWLSQMKHARKLQEEDGLLDDEDQHYPDAGIFLPKGSNQSAKEAQRDKVTTGTDNKWLFSEVGADATGFQHVVGNVAEYVHTDPAAAGRLTAATADAVRQLLGQAASGGRVIGGSALSMVAVQVDRAQEIDRPAGRDGFSDVGFRLAFQAGRERIQTSAWRLLESAASGGYLAPSSP